MHNEHYPHYSHFGNPMFQDVSTTLHLCFQPLPLRPHLLQSLLPFSLFRFQSCIFVDNTIQNRSQPIRCCISILSLCFGATTICLCSFILVVTFLLGILTRFIIGASWISPTQRRHFIGHKQGSAIVPLLLPFDHYDPSLFHHEHDQSRILQLRAM